MYKIHHKYRTLLSELNSRKFDPEFLLYRTKWNLYPIFDVVSSYPLHLDIEVSSRCNLDCSMCLHKTGKFNKQDIDSGTISSFLLSNKNKIYSVKMNWRGEPVLNKNLPVYVKLAKECGVKEVQINTNGLLVNRRKAQELIDFGLDRIIFSVDGYYKETYEKIRKGGNFDVLKENIFKLIELKEKRNLIRPFIRVQMCYGKELKHEALLFKQFWEKKQVQVSLINRQERKELIETSIESHNMYCSQPWQRLTISSEGNVYPCCADWNEKYCLGNVKHHNIYDMWHGKKIRTLRNAIGEGKPELITICRECPKLRV